MVSGVAQTTGGPIQLGRPWMGWALPTSCLMTQLHPPSPPPHNPASCEPHKSGGAGASWREQVPMGGGAHSPAQLRRV